MKVYVGRERGGRGRDGVQEATVKVNTCRRKRNIYIPGNDNREKKTSARKRRKKVKGGHKKDKEKGSEKSI